MKLNINSYYQKGSTFLNSNHLDSAIHYFKISYFFASDNASVINSLAWSLILNKEFNKALDYLEKEISITEKSNTTYPFLLVNLAHAYLLTNNYEKATNIYFNNESLKLNEMLWADAIVTDFNTFINLGIINENYYKIAKKLKRKKMLIKQNK